MTDELQRPTPEEMASMLATSRLVDRIAKQLMCGRAEVADRIERMVAELSELRGGLVV